MQILQGGWKRLIRGVISRRLRRIVTSRSDITRSGIEVNIITTSGISQINWDRSNAAIGGNNLTIVNRIKVHRLGCHPIIRRKLNREWWIGIGTDARGSITGITRCWSCLQGHRRIVCIVRGECNRDWIQRLRQQADVKRASNNGIRITNDALRGHQLTSRLNHDTRRIIIGDLHTCRLIRRAGGVAISIGDRDNKTLSLRICDGIIDRHHDHITGLLTRSDPDFARQCTGNLCEVPNITIGWWCVGFIQTSLIINITDAVIHPNTLVTLTRRSRGGELHHKHARLGILCTINRGRLQTCRGQGIINNINLNRRIGQSIKGRITRCCWDRKIRTNNILRHIIINRNQLNRLHLVPIGWRKRKDLSIANPSIANTKLRVRWGQRYNHIIQRLGWKRKIEIVVAVFSHSDLLNAHQHLRSIVILHRHALGWRLLIVGIRWCVERIFTRHQRGQGNGGVSIHLIVVVSQNREGLKSIPVARCERQLDQSTRVAISRSSLLQRHIRCIVHFDIDIDRFSGLTVQAHPALEASTIFIDADDAAITDQIITIGIGSKDQTSSTLAGVVDNADFTDRRDAIFSSQTLANGCDIQATAGIRNLNRNILLRGLLIKRDSFCGGKGEQICAAITILDGIIKDWSFGNRELAQVAAGRIKAHRGCVGRAIGNQIMNQRQRDTAVGELITKIRRWRRQADNRGAVVALFSSGGPREGSFNINRSNLADRDIRTQHKIGNRLTTVVCTLVACVCKLKHCSRRQADRITIKLTHWEWKKICIRRRKRGLTIDYKVHTTGELQRGCPCLGVLGKIIIHSRHRHISAGLASRDQNMKIRYTA